MRALVYHGPGRKTWEDAADPDIANDTDAIVRVDSVTVCGTDLHILKGDVPEVKVPWTAELSPAPRGGAP
ncbi:MAG: hypothetical protein ACLPKE_06965 [Streptosporangiaceae bacterium]